MLCPIEQDKRWIKLLSFLKDRKKALFYWNVYKENIPDYFYSDPTIISQIPESSEEAPIISSENIIKPGINNYNVEVFIGVWTRQQVASQTDKVFLFGDNTNDRLNTKYIPSATQAVIRGLPNAIGIDTKKDRGTSENKSNPEYSIAVKEANSRPSTTNIPQNLQSGVEQYGTLQYANEEAQKRLGENVTSIEMIESGFRTRTTRTDKELEKYNIKVGSYIKMFGKDQFGNSRNVIVKITKITKGYDESNWYKEGWTEEGLQKLKAHTNSANSVEFEVIKPTISSYFTNADFDTFKQQVDEAIQKAKDSGKTIVIPADGIGTGKAMLKEKAPKLFEYLQQELNKLKEQESGKLKEQKPGLEELSDSNPELANQVYEALGFKILPKKGTKEYRDAEDILELEIMLEELGNEKLRGNFKFQDILLKADRTKGFTDKYVGWRKYFNVVTDMDTMIGIYGYVNEKEGYTQSEDTLQQLLQLIKNHVNEFKIEGITLQQKQQATSLFSEFLDVYVQDFEQVEKILKEEKIIDKDCSGGKLKAEKGLATSFTKGGKWKVIKDLKGYPTHKEGGVDLTIGKNGVSIKNGNTEFIAKHGLVIPKN